MTVTPFTTEKLQGLDGLTTAVRPAVEASAVPSRCTGSNTGFTRGVQGDCAVPMAAAIGRLVTCTRRSPKKRSAAGSSLEELAAVHVGCNRTYDHVGQMSDVDLFQVKASALKWLIPFVDPLWSGYRLDHWPVTTCNSTHSTGSSSAKI